MTPVDVLLANPTSDSARLATGVVTQASPLLVQVGGATVGTPASCLASYTPVLDDFVVLLVQGADRVVLGTVT